MTQQQIVKTVATAYVSADLISNPRYSKTVEGWTKGVTKLYRESTYTIQDYLEVLEWVFEGNGSFYKSQIIDGMNMYWNFEKVFTAMLSEYRAKGKKHESAIGIVVTEYPYGKDNKAGMGVWE